MNFNFQKKTLNFISIILLAILFAQTLFAQNFSQKKENPNIANEQRELVILASERNLDLNPHTSSFSIESQILNGLYEGLFSYNPVTLQSENAICESFKLSRDKKTWTFSIRENAKFSNGKKITANDVKNSWIKMLRTPNAPFASLFDIVLGAKDFRSAVMQNASEEELLYKESKIGIIVKDDSTLVVKLITQTDYLPNILCHPSFSVINENKLVSSGPFALSNKTKDSLTMKKNPNYWDSENVSLPSIKFIFSENMDENTYLYNNGKIDWIIDGVHTSKILSFSDISITPQFGTEYFFFRPVRSPWNNEKLRASLLSALDWDNLQSDSIVKANTLLVPLPEYPEIFGVSEYDIDTAIELMEEAKEELGLSDETEKSASSKPTYENNENQDKNLKIVVAIPDTEYNIGLAKKLAESWNLLGVQVSVLKIPSASYFQSVQNISADLFIYNWIGDFADPMAFLELFRGDSGLNVTGWKDETFDSMLNEAANSKIDVRYEKLSEAEQYLLDQNIIIPISHTVALNILDRSVVKGWYENALNIHPLKNLYIGEKENPTNIVFLGIEKK